jgi:methyltransferase
MPPVDVALAVVVFGFMLVEARRASRNERLQRARGGVEPSGDVYHWMTAAYPASFLAMIAEGVARGPAPLRLVTAGALVFAAAKALKWWAIVSLRDFWTFRVIVVPRAPLVRRGPYRVLRHPNYVGVVGELVGVALMTGALVSGGIATLAFGGLILKRIGVEERALAAADEPRRSSV